MQREEFYCRVPRYAPSDELGLVSMMNEGSLRVIYEFGHSIPLGHGLLWGPILLAPLHVIDDSYCNTLTKLTLSPSVPSQVDRLRLVCSVPSADAALFSTDRASQLERPLAFVDEVKKGDKVVVRFFSQSTSGVLRPETVTTEISEVVAIDRYYYRSAGGTMVSIQNVSAIFLANRLPRGTSGAPAYSYSSSEIVGFIHGNAEVNNWFSICLHPEPLIRSLSALTSAELPLPKTDSSTTG